MDVNERIIMNVLFVHVHLFTHPERFHSFKSVKRKSPQKLEETRLELCCYSFSLTSSFSSLIKCPYYLNLASSNFPVYLPLLMISWFNAFISSSPSGVYKEFSSKWRKSIKPLGIPVLFGEYQKSGYQTLFQEEGCWFDLWGLMLTDVEKYPTPRFRDGFAKR